MINLRTLLSTFDEKGTLLKWLKKVESALNNATLETVNVTVVDAMHVKLKFVFADGTFVESPSIALPEGPEGKQGPIGPQGPQGLQGPQGPTGDDLLVLVDETPEWSGYTSELEKQVDTAYFNRYPKVGEQCYVQYRNTEDGLVYMGTMRVIDVRQDLTTLQGNGNFVAVTGPQGPKGDSGLATVQDLLKLLEGSEYISVDWNEGQTKAVVALDMTNVEDTPTLNSKKLITSGGVFTALQGKLNSTKAAVSSVGGLVKPTTTPTQMELVGISPQMDQERVQLGDGLSYNADTKTLSASGSGTDLFAHTIEFESDSIMFVVYLISSKARFKNIDEFYNFIHDRGFVVAYGYYSDEVYVITNMYEENIDIGYSYLSYDTANEYFITKTGIIKTSAVTNFSNSVIHKI